jgi:hypothetical protein
MSSYNSDNSVLIASADCQTKSHKPGTGSSLCTREHMRYIPLLMYGDPNNLQEYQGKRDLATLKAFVEKHKGQNNNSPPPPDAHEGTCPINGAEVVV